MAALLVAAVTSLAAGFILAYTTDSLEELPGLLMLVPAAIAVQGNIFGALGSRLGTAIHTGTVGLASGRESVVAQNVLVAMALSLVLGVSLAVSAKIVALAFNIPSSMKITDFIVIATIGGMMSAVVVLAITLSAAAGAVRFGWDLDNVVAPLVTAAADVLSLPALVISARLTGLHVLTPSLAWGLAAAAVLAAVWALRSRLSAVRRIARESIPVLAVAGLLNLVAGITIERRLEDFLALPVLLVLLPGFLGTSGALGGVLSSRFATKLHLGLIRPTALPQKPARSDMAMILVLSLVVFVVLGLMASITGAAAGFAGPGHLPIAGVSVFSGLVVTSIVGVVAYYGTLAAVRFGLDPDTYGMPIVMSLLDFVGALTLIVAIVALRVV